MSVRSELRAIRRAVAGLDAPRYREMTEAEIRFEREMRAACPWLELKPRGEELTDDEQLAILEYLTGGEITAAEAERAAAAGATPEAAAMTAPAAPPSAAPDPIEAAVARADAALRRRLTSPAPLPSETVREFYASFVRELHRVAPGCHWRAAGTPDDGRDAWREAYPETADRLDALWRHDPHSERFYAEMGEFVAWLKTRPAADHSATASGGDG